MITAEQARALLDKATPGSWQASDSWAGHNAVLNADGHPIAVCGQDHPESDYFRPSADRRLIAAAPDLAESVIALTERAEKAEAERDTLREQLAEAQADLDHARRATKEANALYEELVEKPLRRELAWAQADLAEAQAKIADAWDEGWRAGGESQFRKGMYRDSLINGPELPVPDRTANPYRAALGDHPEPEQVCGSLAFGGVHSDDEHRCIRWLHHDGKCWDATHQWIRGRHPQIERRGTIADPEPEQREAGYIELHHCSSCGAYDIPLGDPYAGLSYDPADQAERGDHDG